MRSLLERIFDQFDIEDREAQEHEDFLARQRESDMNAELAELEAMSDEEACDFYNVDSKFFFLLVFSYFHRYFINTQKCVPLIKL